MERVERVSENILMDYTSYTLARWPRCHSLERLSDKVHAAQVYALYAPEDGRPHTCAEWNSKNVQPKKIHMNSKQS